MGKLSDKQKLQVVEQYAVGDSCGIIAKRFGVTRSNVRRLLRTRGVVLRSREETTRKHFFDWHYFDVIDSEEKAYWLGFVVAEGNVSNTTLCIQLGAKDKDHLKKFAAAVGYDYFDDYDPKKDAYRVRLNSKILVERLNALGVGEHKCDNITVPGIGERWLRHFFRGFVDGDGSFTKIQDKKRIRQSKKKSRTKYVSLVLSASSDSLQFLLDFKKWANESLDSECGFITTSYLTGKPRYKLVFSGNGSPLKAAKLLYCRNKIAMDRRQDSYKEFLSFGRSKRRRNRG